jgi:NADPH-dependent F420 reductase
MSPTAVGMMTADEPVPIIGGTGALGFGIAYRLAASGTRVVIGSRDVQRAGSAAGRLNEVARAPVARGMANGEAVSEGSILLLCVPFADQAMTLSSLKPALRSGQIVVDATVPLATAVGGGATRVLGVPQGSAAAQAAELVPEGVEVVSAFHSVGAATLSDLAHDLDEDVLIVGRRIEAKRRVAELLSRIPGLRAVNGGQLEAAGLLERLTPLLAGLNRHYGTHAGIQFTGLPTELW